MQMTSDTFEKNATDLPENLNNKILNKHYFLLESKLAYADAQSVHTVDLWV